MNTLHIKKWLKENRPRAREKLAAKAEISVSLIHQMAFENHEPALPIVRRVANAIGIPIEELVSNDGDPPTAA